MNGDFDEDFDFFEDIELPFDENDATCYDGYLFFLTQTDFHHWCMRQSATTN